MLDYLGQADPENFKLRLTSRTDAYGRIDPAGPFGPYLPEWPTNPFSKESVAETIKFAANPVPSRDGSTGWYYSTTTYLLSANSTTGGLNLDPQPQTE